MVRDAAQVDSAVELARTQTNPVGVTGQRDWTVSVRDGSRIVMAPTDAGVANEINQALDTARVVVAKRVDPIGHA